VTEFLVELYAAKTDAVGVARGADRVGRAAAELTQEGTPVRFVRSIFLPEDETCLLLVEADSAETVREAARRAALVFDRVTAAASPPEEDSR
jgi:hypothetical protein